MVRLTWLDLGSWCGGRMAGAPNQMIMLSGGPVVGPSTKIHLKCDGHGRPLSVLLTGGNVNDCTMFDGVLAGVRFRRPGRRNVVERCFNRLKQFRAIATLTTWP